MDEEEMFPEEELHDYADQLMRIIQKNSPVRDPSGTVYVGTYKTGKRAGKQYKRKMPQEIKWHGRVVSPYPGNLKNNGNVIRQTDDGYKLEHGYDPAPYALYANARSRKSKYIEKSIQEFKGHLEAIGFEEEEF